MRFPFPVARSLSFVLPALLPFLYCADASAQANLPIYTSHAVNGFQPNYSWATVNAAATYGGSNCVSVLATNYQAVYFGHADFPTAAYGAVDFWINGGPSGGQALQAHVALDGPSSPSYYLGTLQTNVWQHFTVPFTSLGITNATNCSGFWIQSTINAQEPVFYVCGVQFLATPAPTTVQLNVNAANVIRTADSRWFGFITAIYDGQLDTATTSNLLKQCGCTTLRFPGGSESDLYHWSTGKTTNPVTSWPTSFPNFMHIATNISGAQVFITANYGSGTSNEAAAWVASANITNHCNFKYWEVGNECYGTWEADSNALQHDPVTYATRAAGYIQLMKAKDPTIKIGAVAVQGEDNNVNYSSEVVTNPLTGVTHSGWTPVMLTTFKKMGIYPDFLIYHYYPEYTSSPSSSTDSDPLLLQIADNYLPNALSDWASTAQNLRMQLTDYLGGPIGSNIELDVTENNSDASTEEGKQMTSIVNGLYLADNVGNLMKTEFNSYIWWDLRNGPSSVGDFDPTLYGWRPFGDEGITWGTTNYPVFYAEKLLQYFVRGGDSVVSGSSDYLLLSDYAVQRTNGALTLLVINKDVTTNFNAQIVLTNYAPAPAATIQSYGIAQDEAARTNAPAALQDIAQTTFTSATTNFTYSFPAGTLTLFTFAPAAVQLHSSIVSPGNFILKYQGQARVPYVLQESSNLLNWVSISTNTSSGAVSSITNTVSGAMEYWRVVWHP